MDEVGRQFLFSLMEWKREVICVGGGEVAAGRALFACRLFDRVFGCLSMWGRGMVSFGYP